MFGNFRLRRSHRHIPEGFHFLLEGKPHPLLLPTIINEVASYLSLEDLKNFRLICKSWDVEGYKKIRQISKVVIKDEEQIVQYMKLHQCTPKQRSSISYELRGDLDLGSENVIKFFKLFGEPVEFAYFNKVRWGDGELKNILFDHLPNLSTLAVEARAYSDRRLFIVDEKYETLPKIKTLRLNVFSFITELTTPFLRDLLKACPNLEKISSIKTETRNPLPMQFIQYVCQEMSYDIADDVVCMPYASDIAIAEAIIETKDVVLPKLSVFDFNMRLRTDGLQQLRFKDSPISQLDLTLLSDVETNVIRDVLQRFENTLQVLKLKFHPRCDAASQCAIPRLKNLTHLTLNGYRHSLKFLETLASLKCLTLIRLFFSKAIADEDIQFKFESKLQSLEIHEDFSLKCNSATVGITKKLFPWLKRLKLENLTNQALTAIFESYPNLEEFNGLNGYYTDAAVTGFVTAIEDGLENCHSVDSDNNNPRSPSIKNWKELRQLSLGSPAITDISILDGVVHCANLRVFHLISSKITDVSITTILDKLDLFYFKTEHSFEITKSIIEYAERKMRGRTVQINTYDGPIKQSEIPKFMRKHGSAFVKVTRMSKDEEPLAQQE